MQMQSENNIIPSYSLPKALRGGPQAGHRFASVHHQEKDFSSELKSSKNIYSLWLAWNMPYVLNGSALNGDYGIYSQQTIPNIWPQCGFFTRNFSSKIKIEPSSCQHLSEHDDFSRFGTASGHQTRTLIFNSINNDIAIWGSLFHWIFRISEHSWYSTTTEEKRN